MSEPAVRTRGPVDRSSRLPRAASWALLVLLALLLAAPALPLATAGGVPSGSAAAPVARPGAAAAPSVSELGPTAGPAASTLTTGGTIVSVNGSIEPGNVQPWNLAVPMGIVMDPSGLGPWVSGAYSGTLGLYSPTNTSVVVGASLGVQATYPTGFGGAATAMVAVPSSGQLYVASPGTGQVLVASASTGALETTIPLGNHSVPTALARDAAASLIFVADEEHNRIAFLNTTNQTIVANVTVGSEPDALWYDPGSGFLFVADRGSQTVSVVNVTDHSVYGLPVGIAPVALTEVGSRVWVLNQGSGNISFLNAQTIAVAGSVALPNGSVGEANGFVYDTLQATIYVLNAPAGHLALLNASDGTSTGTVSIGGTPYAGTYDAVRGEIDITDTSRNMLFIVSDATNSVVRSAVLGAAPMASFFDASTGLVYVADASVAELRELDARTDSVVGTVALFAPAIDLAYAAPVGVLAIVLADGSVSFFDPTSNTLLGSWGLTNGTVLLHGTYGNGEFFFTGGQPYGPTPFHDVFAVAASGFGEINCVGAGSYDAGVTYDGSNHYVYVATNTSILIVSSYSNDRVGSIALPTGGSAFGIAYSAAANALAVSDWFSGGVYMFNITNAAYDATPLSVLHPGVITYLAATNTFYIGESANASIWAIVDAGGGSYAKTQIAVGLGPNFVSYSALSGLLYVANAAGGTLSLIQLGSAPTVPMVVTASITPTTLAIGGSLTVRTFATYPMWNDTFNYSGLPKGCPSRNASSFVCTPNQTGTFIVVVAATNPYHVSASTVVRIAVFTPLAVVSFVATPSEFTLGTATQVTVEYSGGVAPITVGYPVRPPGCAATNLTNWSCKPTTAGNFTLETTVTDSAGHNLSANLSLIVNPHLTITSFTPSLASLTVGQNVTFTVVLSGGTAPYTFAYTGLPPGCTSTNSSSFRCAPTAGGAYYPVVRITDGSGVVVTQNTTVVVASVGGNTGPSTSGLSLTDLLLIVVIVVVAAVGLVGAALWRRGRGAPPAAAGRPAPRPPPPPEEEPEPAEEEPEVTVVEAPPPEPLLPPTPPPAPRPPPPRYHVDPEAARRPAPRPQPVVAGAARPPLVCSNCGTSNEPWLTVCRKCKRSLHSTGTV